MRSQARVVIVLVAILTVFSLYTIIKNRPKSNFQAKESELTTPYNRSEDENFLDPNYEEPQEKQSPSQLPDSNGLINESEEDASNDQTLADILDSPSEVDKFDFSSCKMSDCFDYSLCDSSRTLKVHIIPKSQHGERAFNTSGESNIIYENILSIIRSSRYFEPDPKKACIFVLEDDTLDRDPLSPSFRAVVKDIFQMEHRFGMNYLIFNFYSGSWPDYKEDDFAGLKLGAAILAKASNSRTSHRRGFDISVPLLSYQHAVHDEQNQNSTVLIPDSRKDSYFLTFKGKRYVLGSGSDTRNSLYHLNNHRDVVMLTTCRHGKKWRDIKNSRCDEEEVSYSQYDFVELMKNSTFCLTPRGRRLGSFRFLEALSYGCIPVILSDGWVWPFDEIIDWSDAALQFPEDQILLVPDMLRDISEDKIARMRRKCHELYHKYFSSLEKIVLTTLSIIEARTRNKLV